MNPNPEQIVVAVAGASGSIYAQRLLQHLAALGPAVEVAVVFSRNAREIWRHELGAEPATAFRVYDERDFTAPFASGSSRFAKMAIVPCSTGTLARIATGATDNLITRAAEVMLKERRRLVCVVRETPYSLIHLDNMRTVTVAGGIICPATPSFYSQPATIEAVADTVVFRVLDLLGLPHPGKRWGEYATSIAPGAP
jgi:4-hydroxy-3-polyprenylbenzoate decarboxylase